MTSVFSDIGKKFLDDVDVYIKENLKNIRCTDIWKLYDDFVWALKDRKGTSSGFTGLSEYLIVA